MDFLCKIWHISFEIDISVILDIISIFIQTLQSNFNNIWHFSSQKKSIFLTILEKKQWVTNSPERFSNQRSALLTYS
jgi:hypothetical protein